MPGRNKARARNGTASSVRYRPRAVRGGGGIDGEGYQTSKGFRDGRATIHIEMDVVAKDVQRRASAGVLDPPALFNKTWQHLRADDPVTITNRLETIERIDGQPFARDELYVIPTLVTQYESRRAKATTSFAPRFFTESDSVTRSVSVSRQASSARCGSSPPCRQPNEKISPCGSSGLML